MKETVLKQAKQKHELNRDAFQIIYQNVMCHCHDALYENGSFDYQVKQTLSGHGRTIPGNTVIRVLLPEKIQDVPLDDEKIKNNLEEIKYFFGQCHGEHKFVNYQICGNEQRIYFRLQTVDC